ncbi:MAG: YlxR family protein [Kineosporiaceae bacterium]
MGCRVRAHRSVLLRVVAAGSDGFWSVVPDPGCTHQGRGAWVHPRPECLELAERRRVFPRALRREGRFETSTLRAYLVATARDALREPVRAGSGSEADEHPMSTQR